MFLENRAYRSDIARFPPLPPEWQREYTRRVYRSFRVRERLERTGETPSARDWEIIERGERARKILIERNLRLVVSIARRYLDYPYRGLELPDLIQEGILGLDVAIARFDPTLGDSFSTYARHWIQQAIAKALKDRGRVIRLPVHVYRKLAELRSARERIVRRSGREATLLEIARELGTSVARVGELLAALPRATSLDTGASGGRGGVLESVPAVIPNIEGELVRESLAEKLAGLLGELSPREREIIQLRYGLTENRESLSRTKIGARLKISAERVRQIENGALAKLRERQSRVGLESFID